MSRYEWDAAQVVVKRKKSLFGWLRGKAWSEEDHPRDEYGRFTEGDAALVAEVDPMVVVDPRQGKFEGAGFIPDAAFFEGGYVDAERAVEGRVGRTLEDDERDRVHTAADRWIREQQPTTIDMLVEAADIKTGESAWDSALRRVYESDEVDTAEQIEGMAVSLMGRGLTESEREAVVELLDRDEPPRADDVFQAIEAVAERAAELAYATAGGETKVYDYIPGAPNNVVDTAAQAAAAGILQAAGDFKADPIEVRDAAIQTLNAVASAGTLAVRVEPDTLAEIISDGQLRNQHETETSGGMYNPDRRQEIEYNGFGIEPGSEPSQYPIYGFLTFDHDPTDQNQGYALQYGHARIELSDDVKERATFGAGDSLSYLGNESAVPTPLTNPSVVGAAGVVEQLVEPIDGGGVQGLAATDFDSSPGPGGYWETQIHGGVELDDIERVVFTGLSGSPSEELLSELIVNNIPFVLQPDDPDDPDVVQRFTVDRVQLHDELSMRGYSDEEADAAILKALGPVVG